MRNCLKTSMLCTLISLFSHGVGFAQQNDSYHQLIKQGVSEYSLGNWSEAYAMFEKAYREQPGPRPLRGMAFALFELKRYVETKHTIEKALSFKSHDKPLSDQQRSELQQLLQRTAAYIVTVTVKVKPEDAEIRIDGQEVHAPQMWVDPGSHSMIVSAAGYQSQVIEFEAKIGRQPNFKLSLKETSTPSSSEPSDFQLRDLRWLYWTVTGVGIAALVTSAITGSLTKDIYEDIESKCPGEECRTAWDADSNKGKTLETVTNVFLVGGLVLIVAGVTPLVLDYGEFLDDGETENPIAKTKPIEIVPICDFQSCAINAKGVF